MGAARDAGPHQNSERWYGDAGTGLPANMSGALDLFRAPQPGPFGAAETNGPVGGWWPPRLAAIPVLDLMNSDLQGRQVSDPSSNAWGRN